MGALSTCPSQTHKTRPGPGLPSAGSCDPSWGSGGVLAQSHCEGLLPGGGPFPQQPAPETGLPGLPVSVQLSVARPTPDVVLTWHHCQWHVPRLNCHRGLPAFRLHSPS